MDITVHPTTRQTLEALHSELPQSILLSGTRGVGLLTLATWLASDQLVLVLRPQDSKEHTDSQNGSISIEMVRKLYDQTRAKHTKRQIIIIDDADRMSHGAQSAFLKLLEEPNSHIYFILTSHSPQKLLATIRSRVQPTVIQPLSLKQSMEFVEMLGVKDMLKKTQLQFIAEGLPAELTRLVNDPEYFAKCAEVIGDARDFLQADNYKKLLIAQKYRGSREQSLQLVKSAMQILRRSLSARPQHGLVVQLEQLLAIEERIVSNGNIPLQLAQFVL